VRPGGVRLRERFGGSSSLRSGSANVCAFTPSSKALSLYHADSKVQLAGLLDAMPLYDWMNFTVTPLDPHPDDPVFRRPFPQPLGASNER
jgi:hypothetical protein